MCTLVGECGSIVKIWMGYCFWKEKCIIKLHHSNEITQLKILKKL